MRIKTLIVIFLLITFSNIYAGTIAIRKNKSITEIKFEIKKEQVKNHFTENNNLIIEFYDDLNLNLNNNINDNFIKNIFSKNNKLYIELKNKPNTFLKFSKNNLLIILSPQKKVKNIKLNTQIEKQLINKKKSFTKDQVAEKKLLKINNLIENNPKKAIEEITKFTSEYTKGYYAQEGLFRLGLAYMALGKESDKYYIDAASVFEEFAKDYHDSYLMPDALWEMAQAKEKAGIYYEAIFSYQKIIKTLPDTEIGKSALKAIGMVYYKIGQYDNALTTFKQYMKKYNVSPNDILSNIGLVYVKKNDYQKAFLYFSKIYQRGIDYTAFSPEILFAMGETFEKTNNVDEALNIYTKLYNLYPNDKNANIAMYKAAVLMDKKGKNQLSKELFLSCKEKYKNTKGALLSALYIAEKEKDLYGTEYWLDFLTPVLENDIDVNLKTKANLFIISKLFNEKRYEQTLSKIKTFEKTYFDSPLLNTVYDIKQKVYIEQAKDAFKLAQFDKTNDIINILLKEFPNTKYRKDAEKILEKTKFAKIEKIFKNNNFLNTIKEIENFYLNSKKIYFPKRWTSLLDSAYYEYIKKLLKSGEENVALIFSRQYLIDLKQGKHAKEIKNNLEKLIEKNITDLFNNKSFLKVIKFYEVNKIWIDNSNNIKFKDRIKSYVAYSLYKLGEDKSAKSIISTIKNKNQKSLAMIMYLLGIKQNTFDVNNLSRNELKFIVDELKKSNPNKILSLLDTYNKNIKLRYKLKYKVIKEINNKKLLIDLYNEISLLYDDIKKENIDLFFDAGSLYFKQKKYEKSLKALDVFIKFANKNNTNFPNALYLAGNSALKQKLDIKAKKLLNKLIKDYPDSEFANYAKIIIEDMNWNKKLTN